MTNQALLARYPVPALNVPLVGGGRFVLGASPAEKFDLIVFYRGLHCPICTKYLLELERIAPEFAQRGVQMLALSSDEESRGAEMAQKVQAKHVKFGYGLSSRPWRIHRRSLTKLARRVLLAFALIGICSAGAQAPEKQAQRFPDVVSVKVKALGNNTFDFDVTVSSPYDTPQRYADAFRATSLDGKPLGERILGHDHQDEQPFTRDLHGVKIPAHIKKVLIQARDQKFGYGGKVVELALPGR